MPLSRRVFVQTLGVGAAGVLTSSYIGARGREHSVWSLVETPLGAVQPGMIVLSSNENPLGPGKTVLDAVRGAFGPNGGAPGRYPFNGGPELVEAIAHKFKVKNENVVLGCGSTQILRSATHLFTSKDKALVGTIPTYEECAGYAEMMGHPVRGVSLDSEFRIDLDKMAAAAKGAGLVFYCNPNNPTATYVGAKATREFIAKVNRESPDTTILVDEAYYDYVTDPDHDTHVPIAIENPRVIVARTFSKAYGMAGLRQGYALGHPETLKKLRPWMSPGGTGSLNVFGMAAATVAIGQDATFTTNERNRNKEVRDFATKWFKEHGMKPTDCQANFMFVDIGMPAKEFRDACRAKNVLVGRDFPPYEKTHARISLGTMEEMQKAVKVFGEVAAKKTTTAAA
jgi:histidinol-phosphate aminotransferase